MTRWEALPLLFRDGWLQARGSVPTRSMVKTINGESRGRTGPCLKLWKTTKPGNKRRLRLEYPGKKHAISVWSTHGRESMIATYQQNRTIQGKWTYTKHPVQITWSYGRMCLYETQRYFIGALENHDNMIQTIFLSTAIAFTTPIIQDQSKCKLGDIVSECTRYHHVKCQAFEEVQGWEWGPWNRQVEWSWHSDKDYKKDDNGNYFVREREILWRKLIGYCDDGTVRWKEEKPWPLKKDGWLWHKVIGVE